LESAFAFGLFVSLACVPLLFGWLGLVAVFVALLGFRGFRALVGLVFCLFLAVGLLGWFLFDFVLIMGGS